MRKIFLLSCQWDSKRAIIQASKKKEVLAMRGYFTAGGFYGLVNGAYLLFPDETEYYEYVKEYGEVA